MKLGPWRKAGPKVKPVEDRLRNLIAVDPSGSGCWLWTGNRHKKTGYGTFGMSGKTMLAHRASYQVFKGEIPEGYEIDHLCRVRRCVNPEHLEAVTTRENALRSNSVSGINSRKTMCLKGHPLTPENTNVSCGKRTCRECKRLRVPGKMRRLRRDCIEQ